MSENLGIDDLLPGTSLPSAEAIVPMEPSFEYELLTGHRRTDGTFKSSVQLRSEYAHLTDGLVHKMVDGVEVIDHKTNETVTRKPDIVIWLDKSARPVSWLTKELWPILAADKNGKVPELPEFRYLNIDREQWVNTIDPEGVGRVDINRVDPSIIRSLRSIFVAPKYLKDGLTPEIDAAPTELDNKTVLIIDEVRATGRTLEIAEKFLKRAFPLANVGSTHWMKGATMVGQAIGNADLPVWYKEDDERGRGVANRNENKSRLSTSSRQRLGAWFLSTVWPEQDPGSTQLRQEFKHLSQEIRNHKLVVVPAIERELEDFDERALRYNNVTTLEEFKNAKLEQNQTK